MLAYENGLLGIKDAAAYMRRYADEMRGIEIDELQLAFHTRDMMNSRRFSDKVDEQTEEAAYFAQQYNNRVSDKISFFGASMAVLFIVSTRPTRIKEEEEGREEEKERDAEKDGEGQLVERESLPTPY